MAVDFAHSRLALLSFLFLKLSCNGGLFCINLGNLSIDLQLDFVCFSLAKHVNWSSLDYWDFGVSVNTDNLFVNYKLWAISNGLIGCVEFFLGCISGRSLCLNCLLQSSILGLVVG